MDTEITQPRPTKVALVVIYNYRFDKNIDTVEKIYTPRFSHIFHLVPFYTGRKPNVIPVYEHSYHFQGHVAQGFPGFHHDDFTHYFFIHDDLVVNPAIDERNFMAEMQLPDDHAFITRFNPHNTGKAFWIHVKTAFDWKVRQNGLNIVDELPPPDTVTQRFKRLNLPHAPPSATATSRQGSVKNASTCHTPSSGHTPTSSSSRQQPSTASAITADSSPPATSG
jgi:hypothetical protein